jgi:hypothetical protein
MALLQVLTLAKLLLQVKKVKDRNVFTRGILTFALISVASFAGAGTSVSSKAMQSFANNCFSPFITAEKAAVRLAVNGARSDFYDLDPFSSAAPSPVTGRAASDGTDRRCEVAFDGDHAEQAAKTAADALQQQGIIKPAELPAFYMPADGTTLLAARQLNPRRIAVVHVGTRKGPDGIETYMTVERLTPSELTD